MTHSLILSIRPGILGVLFVFICFLSVTEIFAQYPDSIETAIIIRDFQPTHPDFENFDTRRPYANPPMIRQCGVNPEDTVYVTEENVEWAAAVFGIEARRDLVGKPMMYGAFGDNPELKNQGLMHHTNMVSSPLWSEPVVVTKGMVQRELYGYSPTLSPMEMLMLTPTKSQELCDNSYFEQWFSDVEGVNLRIEERLALAKETSNSASAKPQYFLDSDNSNGFYPLDNPDYYSNIGLDNYGPQNLNIWCPPPALRNPSFRDYEAPEDNPDLCEDFWTGFDASTGSSTVVAGADRARNYNFTMMGYTQFTYEGGEKLMFGGDDDLWVFVDGKLVIDLGGVHHPAEVVIDLDDLAQNTEHNSNSRDWNVGSVHDLHFYYAERQSPASNFKMYLPLYNVTLADGISSVIESREGVNTGLTGRIIADPELGSVYLINPKGQKMDLNGRVLQ